MKRVALIRWMGFWAVVGVLAMEASPLLAQSGWSSQNSFSGGTSQSKPSFTASVTAPLKRGASKVAQWFKPAPAKAPMNEAISLRTKSKPTAKLYVSLARLYQESGKTAEAQKQYEKALELTPDYLGALLGYARLKDRLGQPNEAARLYEQAIKAHPEEASVYNNFGLFHARHGQLEASVDMLHKAIDRAPRDMKYRNNIAPVLVQMGRNGEAFTQLQTAHGDAIAYYNLGFHIEKKGNKDLARQHYAMALKFDSTLAAARQGLQRLPEKARSDEGLPVEGPSLTQRRAASGQRFAERFSRDGKGQTGGVRQLPPPPEIPAPPTPNSSVVPRRLPQTAAARVSAR